MSPDARRTAYHEAGHAVVAQFCGLEVRYVALQNNGGVACIHGLTATTPGPVDEAAEMCRLMVKVAGSVAERLEMDDSEPDAERNSAVELLMLPWSGVREVGLSTEQATRAVENLESQAMDILKDNWMVVDQLARALMEQKRLEVENLDSVLLKVDAGQIKRNRVLNSLTD